MLNGSSGRGKSRFYQSPERVVTTLWEMPCCANVRASPSAKLALESELGDAGQPAACCSGLRNKLAPEGLRLNRHVQFR